jgi:hypothetical protein
MATDKFGPPGLIQTMIIVPIFGENDSSAQGERRLKDLTLRKFRVIARLAISNDFNRTNIDVNFEETSGDSLLAISDSIAKLRVGIFDGDIMLIANPDKRLSAIQIECMAKSTIDAHGIFHKVVGPALDHFAYIGNVPLQIVQVTIIDETHHISSTEVIIPYPIVTLNPGAGKIMPVLEPVYAMYREAKNAQSPFYKFFCLHKILDGLLNKLSGRIYKVAKDNEIILPPFEAKTPHYHGMPGEQEKYIGKSIKRFFKEYLTQQFRNSMAHFMSDEGAVLNVNAMDGIQRYWSVVHITELCCREVITHFEACINILERQGIQIMPE